MKNIQTKIILLAIIFLSVAGFACTANATGPYLYVSPATLTKTAGNIFNVSVGVNPSGSKACAVEGTLVFNNLTCQSITVSDNIDIVPQSSPTCSNPHFLIGVQNCTTSDRVLFTASVKAGSAGTASISPTGVDIIGEGASVGSASTSGNYTINTAPTPTPAPKPAPTPTPKPTPTPTPENKLPTNVGPASLATIAYGYFWPILIVLIIVGIGHGIYYFVKRKKNSTNSTNSTN